MTTVTDVWRALEQELPVGNALAARPALPGVTSRLLAAVDREGTRHLVVQLSEHEAAHRDQKSRGISVETRELSVAGQPNARYLDMVCRDAIGHDVFDTIAHEFARALAARVEEPGAAAKRLVAKWRRFWQSSAGPQLSREEQVGLFAELWFLAYWVAPRYGIEQAVSAWKGPLAGVHDFELPRLAVEVKASELNGARRHRVNGIDQLAVPEGDALFLFSLAVRNDPTAANSLPTAVEVVRGLLTNADEAIVDFEAKLFEVGLSADAGMQYSELKLRVLDERLFVVRDPFPRLTRDSLRGGMPPGVNGIRYLIDLGGFDQLIVARRPEEWSGQE